METDVFVGREPELRWISERLAQGGRILLIVGEAGIGKTSLLACSTRGTNVLAHVVFPKARFAVPANGLRVIGESAGAAGASLRAELQESEEEPQGWKLQAIWSAADRIALGARAGDVIVLDDFQWTDDLTLGWVSQLAPVLPQSDLSIVAAIRAHGALPDKIARALHPLQRAGFVEVLDLQAFSKEEVERLVLASGVAAPSGVAAAIFEATEGLPLAASELLSRWDRYRSARSAGSPRVAAQVLPVLTGTIREQFNTLGDDAREILGLIAAQSPPALEDLARSVAGWSAERFDRALEEALRSGLLLQTPQNSVAFRHELQREIVQSFVPLAERRLWHARLAEMLVAQGDSRGSEIAEHFAAAGLPGLAVEWFERSAHQAARWHDYGIALGQFQAASEHCFEHETDTLVRLAERAAPAANACDRRDLALELIQRALHLCPDPEHQGRLLLSKASLMGFALEHEARFETLQKAGTIFDKAGNLLGLARASAELAIPLGPKPALEERIIHGERALELARTMDDPLLRSRSASNLATAKGFGGDPADEQLYQEALDAIQGNPQYAFEASRTKANWSLCALARGDYAEAEAVLNKPTPGGLHPSFGSVIDTHHAVLSWRTGRWGEVTSHLEIAASGVARPQLSALADVLRGAIEFERTSAIDMESLATSIRTLMRIDAENWGALALANLIRLRTVRREPRPGRELHALLDGIFAAGIRAGWDDLVWASTLLAHDIAEEALSRFQRFPPLGPRADAAMLLAKGRSSLRRRRGDAPELLLAAAEAYGLLPEPYMQAWALESAATALVAEGKQGGRLRVQAAEIYQHLGADRSLAALLRTCRHSRALDAFRIPKTQVRSGAPGLTAREKEIAELAARGYPSSEIASMLNISAGTAKNHLKHIKDKLGVTRKSDLIRMFNP